MQIIINPQAKKYIPWIFVAVLFATMCLIFTDVRYYFKYHNFVQVNAVITNIERYEVTSPSSENRSSYYNYITYEYTFKRKTYNATRTELTRIGKKKRKEVTIKCNPDLPGEIQDVYSQNMCKMITIFCFVMDWFLWMAMRQMRKEKDTEWR